ncbi:MAG: twin-arginine translocase subunit TatC [Anaerolineae bacterium]|jgi:sec-independent protein translocase protein TatC|nr:twin-arginine translocase subunit TatC [Anaerolineae bacterium]
MLKKVFRRKPAAPALPPADQPEDGHTLQMGLFEHLNELRTRLFRAALAVALGTLIGLIISGEVLNFLREPYCRAVETGESCQLLIIDPTGGVIVYFRVALLVGGILSIPVVTYQVLMFIVPGLTDRERRYLLLAMPAITFLFLVGVAFSWYVLMPPALGFLENFQPLIFKTDWTADLYLSFVTALVFWMGVAFETPLIFFVLSILGLITPGTMLRNWRVAVVGASAAAALITPTIDPVNMFLVMAPLLTLYALSIVLVAIGSRINRPAGTFEVAAGQ